MMVFYRFIKGRVGYLTCMCKMFQVHIYILLAELEKSSICPLSYHSSRSGEVIELQDYGSFSLYRLHLRLLTNFSQCLLTASLVILFKASQQQQRKEWLAVNVKSQMSTFYINSTEFHSCLSFIGRNFKLY